MPPLSVSLVVVLVSCWLVLSGTTLTACGLFICHTETVIGDGLAAMGLDVAALIASALVKGRGRSLWPSPRARKGPPLASRPECP